MHRPAVGPTLIARVEHYRQESDRIGRLADDAGAGGGGERYREVAQEYRWLADALESASEVWAPQPLADA